MSQLIPIAPGLWTDETLPRLIGGQRKADSKIVFPMPGGDAANDYDALPLQRTGTLWSWTVQNFEPKSPYSGAKPFKPYGVAYVELSGEVIVEARLTKTEGLRIGMAMELVIEDFDETHATFAFKPVEDV